MRMLPHALVGTSTTRPTRPTVADVWLAGGLLVTTASLGMLVPIGAPYRAWDAIGLALGTASGLCLLWRQVAPLPVVAVASSIVVVNAALGYAVTVVQWPVWIALFTCFFWYGWRSRALAVAIVALGVAGYVVFDRGPFGASELTSISVSVLIAAVTGDAMRSRRASAAAAEARLTIEAREQAMRAEQMLVQERSRLARELHDALGHAVNVMVMQAGVGRRVFDDNPGFARDALAHIETVGREALDELDRLVRILGDRRGDETVPAESTVSDLSELAARVQSAGRDIRVSAGEVELSPSAARAMHRIIQEAVTNALRHSESGRITVDVAQAGDTVAIEVHNEGGDFPVPVPGRGLINMRERARLEGGELEAGPTDDGFRVRATLPAGRPAATYAVPA
jgi:signal transduction histidine kinase